MSTVMEKGTQFNVWSVDGISANALVPYLEQSGDDNPLHRDPSVAASIGLPAIPVPGQLVMAIIERYLGATAPGNSIKRLTVKFVSPVFVDRSLDISGRVAAMRDEGCSAVIRIRVLQEGRPAVLGEAEINLNSPAE